jgi:mono/diheme cytochrome c family protein
MRAIPIVVTLTALTGAAASGQAADTLPADITEGRIQQGKLLYEGPGRCIACHGADGTGAPAGGSDLTDTTWVHSDGSFEGILHQIKAGVPAEHSAAGIGMPERGASRLTENQLRFVAAYVWSLRRQPDEER